jgi:hypothetical protein
MDIDPGLLLPNRDAIELAWLSVYTTGNAPTITPVLDSLIDCLPPRQSPNREQGAALYLDGEMAGVMKQELAQSLGIIATYSDNPITSEAAATLLQNLAT